MDVTALETGGADMQSATGHVEFIGRQGADNRYSFSAIKRVHPATGETIIQGEVQYQSHRPDGTVIDAHGTVICLEIEGNLARVGLVGDHARGLPEGTSPFAYFTVVDNGEGNDPPDLASNLFIATEAVVLQHCESGHIPAPPLFPNLVGNIQVRP
ncbi:MAG: hypothetical protein E6J82_15320 [Deltaproteobacteria bacterium]|nr:MAG: hypothetical protein E6J82_15320 [Deltaproteobacteria bacterium]TMA75181.1 MAG: hypothetical protein E6J67_09515 [Deltaproteobacteria bacterium]TMB35733.1 MAG: hypothetical protein E6J58_16245 [Deltaproteobacteria bacterium]